MSDNRAGNASHKLQDFYTIAELAQRWRVSTRHIRRLIDSGELKATRFGKSVRIAAADVALYEAMHRM